MQYTADQWVEKLDMAQHPEGGFFKEVYRSDEVIQEDCLPERYEGERSISTSIYFLLKSGQISAFHKLKSEETWHFYDGCPVRVYMIDEDGVRSERVVGRDPEQGQLLQYTISRNVWFAAQPEEENSFTLIGCTVAPGFDFRDFELARKIDMVNRFPKHRELIEALSLD